MDMENSSLSFLNALVNRHPDGTLGHTVYRKPTHIDLYLHAKFNHHVAKKGHFINTDWPGQDHL